MLACADDEAASPAAVGLEAGPDVVSTTPAADATVDAAIPRGRDRLSQTGLYSDIAAKTLGPDVIEFEPTYVLWSDGAKKTRWVRLPAGATIDTTDPDHWVFPVGTQFFKQFEVDGKRIETRLVERISATGDREKDYFLGAFLWRADESDADFVKDGKENARGTLHDVPTAEQCWSCHIGEPGHALGFSALQLSHDGGGHLDLAMLRAMGVVPSSLADHPIQGDAVAKDGVGYLHANCGHCHNPNGIAWPDTNMQLRYGYGDESIATSKVLSSTVGVATHSYEAVGVTARIEPGDPDASAVIRRLSARGNTDQMPPLATEVVDPDGVARVRTWIQSMPPRDAGTD